MPKTKEKSKENQKQQTKDVEVQVIQEDKTQNQEATDEGGPIPIAKLQVIFCPLSPSHF